MDALHTCVDELQPKTNGVLRRTGAGRLFATVTQLTRIKRPNKSDFVRGIARCFQLRISIAFNLSSFATSPLHFGPVILPSCDPSHIVKRKTILYGMVIKTARGFQFLRCTKANELYFFFTSAFRPVQFLCDNVDALCIAGKHDLFALAMLLQNSFDVVLQPLRKYIDERDKLTDSKIGNIQLSHTPVDFVILTSMLVRDASIYGKFVALVHARKSKMHKSLVHPILDTAVPFDCLQEFIDQSTNEKLDVALNANAMSTFADPQRMDATRDDNSSNSELSC